MNLSLPKIEKNGKSGPVHLNLKAIFVVHEVFAGSLIVNIVALNDILLTFPANDFVFVFLAMMPLARVGFVEIR